jgi:NAD(P)-dependent dehydrogenase (short-subunit alcohol dehydrogenase family)
MKNPVSAIVQGLVDLTRPQGTPVPSLTRDERLDGAVVLITGANRGLGKSISVQTAQRGARVIMACRTGIPEAGEEVMRESGSRNVEMRSLDLSDLRSVSVFCDELERDHVKVDVLILNAGVVPREARPTAQGFELMFGVNYLANVLLVEELLRRKLIPLERTPRARIVFVSSDSHRGAGPVNFEKLGEFASYGGMGGVKVYGYSKLLLNTYAAYLARRLGDQVAVHSCCPGPVNTDIAREAPEWVKPVLGRVMEYFFRPADEAAESVMVLSCGRELGNETGVYVHRMMRKPADAESLRADVGERLFEQSQKLLDRAIGPYKGSAR